MLGLPMVEEADATGTVAEVYRDMRTRWPLIPSPFKSLAVNPTYLRLAWAQVRDATGLAEAAAAFYPSVMNRIDAPDLDIDALRVATELRGVDRIVPMTLLAVTLLERLLDGSITEDAVVPNLGPAGGSKNASDVTLRGVYVIRQADADPSTQGIFTDIQITLDVAFVSSIFKILASAKLLPACWTNARPWLCSDSASAAYELIQRWASETLASLSFDRYAGPTGLAKCEIVDALGALRQLLHVYRTGIPKVLLFLRLVAP